MPSLLVELFDHHTIEKNVYQTFICDCDEVLFLSLKKNYRRRKVVLETFFAESSFPCKASAFSANKSR